MSLSLLLKRVVVIKIYSRNHSEGIFRENANVEKNLKM
jgi:hypothetical protein